MSRNETLTPQDQAIAAAADTLHEAWKQAYFEQNGQGAARWKPMKPASLEWAEQRGDLPTEAIKKTEQGMEINIAGLTNSQLPPQFSGENTASAKGAIEAIAANPKADIDALASVVHDQWLERNGSWASEDLKKPYAELSEAEKEKDRAVVRVAQEAITGVGGLEKPAVEKTSEAKGDLMQEPSLTAAHLTDAVKRMEAQYGAPSPKPEGTGVASQSGSLPNKVVSSEKGLA